MSAGNTGPVVIAVNHDYEALGSDPENRSRADIAQVARDVQGALADRARPVEVVAVGDDVAAALAEIEAHRPAAVFNLCESLRGEGRFEPLLPLLLELRGIAYTGSEPLALASTLHKIRCKEILRAHGVPTPASISVAAGEAPALALRFPVIVKPSREDASVGITLDSVIADAPTALARAHAVAERYRQPALVEEFVPGREIYVSKLDRADGTTGLLPLFEIDFSAVPAGRPHILSYNGKWDESSDEYRTTPSRPAVELAPEVARRIQDCAERALAALGVRDYGRVDLRIARDGTPFVIEINPNCDLARGAGFAKAAAAAGIAYEELVRTILDRALARQPAR